MFTARLLKGLETFLEDLPQNHCGAVLHSMQLLQEGAFDQIEIKKLRGDIRELIVNKYRIVYFKIGATLYFVSGFRKKSKKTPQRVIDYAERVYKLYKN